jgi:DNA-directed RNA polymerase specialized sigma subunit
MEKQETVPESLNLYGQWKARPSRETLTPVIKALAPTIDSALTSYGYQGNETMRTAAQLHLAKSLPRFDPSKNVKLETFAFNELKRLQRIGPKQEFAIPRPEASALDLRNVETAEQELSENYGREPTANELSDATGISVKRITTLKQRYGMPVVTQEAAEGYGASGTTDTTDGITQDLWVDAIYEDLDPIDKKILDWSMGRNGSPRLKKTDIAIKLGISIPAVTQRAQKIMNKLSEGMEYNVI